MQSKLGTTRTNVLFITEALRRISRKLFDTKLTSLTLLLDDKLTPVS